MLSELRCRLSACRSTVALAAAAVAVSRRRTALIKVVLLSVRVALAGCNNNPSGSPETASNAVIDVGHRGLDSNDLPHAYARLCAAQRSKVSQDEFVRTSGEAVSPIFTRRGWDGREGKDDPPDVKTLDSSVTQATRVYRVQKKTGPTGLDFVYEEWKISLVREDGKWKLCGFDMVDTYPLVQDYETKCATTTIKGCP